jgi:hypothetical protein
MTTQVSSEQSIIDLLTTFVDVAIELVGCLFGQEAFQAMSQRLARHGSRIPLGKGSKRFYACVWTIEVPTYLFDLKGS